MKTLSLYRARDEIKCGSVVIEDGTAFALLNNKHIDISSTVPLRYSKSTDDGILEGAEWIEPQDSDSYIAALHDALLLQGYYLQTNEAELRHLPGEHNQKTHGGSGGSVDLSHQEQQAIGAYTLGTTDNDATPLYERISRHLRGGESISEKDLEIVRHLDSAIAKSPVIGDQSLVLYRGISGQAASKLKNGESLYDAGYVSASTSEWVAKDFASEKQGGKVIKLVVNPNHHALFTGDFSSNPNEQEVIMPRGMQWNVVKRRGSDVELHAGFEDMSPDFIKLLTPL